MPKLEELYMAQNLITTITGWENLPALRKLHLRKNKIDKVPEEEMPDLPALEYINLRRNNIEKLEVIEKLFQFKLLTDINVLNNPIDQNASSKDLLFAQVLHKNPGIKRFNKQLTTEKNLL
jgi:Leucine-rich repeat (LRR) protein